MTQIDGQRIPTIPPVLKDLTMTLNVRIGQTKRSVRDILAMNEGLEVGLDARVDDPVELCVDDRVIAHGELVDDGEGNLAVRVTKILDTTAP